MKKEIKFLIALDIIIILFLIVLFIVLYISDSKKNNIDFNNLITNITTTTKVVYVNGIYHTDNWNGQEETLILYEDYTCKYPGSYYECTWKLDDNTISITTYTYFVKYDNNITNKPDYFSHHYSKDECYISLGAVKTDSSFKNPRCEKESNGTTVAAYIDEGLLLNNHIFKKIG